jgi:tetratricopeptide (TPR) repeat protein
MPSPLVLRRLLWLGLVLLVALPYLAPGLSILDAPFVYDDKVEILGNRAIRIFEDWRSILGYNVSRPLLMLSYAADFHRGLADPTPYHWTSLAVHALAMLAALGLAESVARLAGASRPLLRAAVVVALWAIHPMATESVTYLTGRSEALCGLFTFAALGAWCRALLAERQGESGLLWRVLGLVGFFGAAASKEVAAMVPVAMVVLELALAPHEGLRARVRAVRWWTLLPAALLIAVAIYLRASTADQLLPREVERPLPTQLTTSVEVWRHYLRLWLLPVGQTILHDQPDVALASLRGAGAWAGWLAMGGAVGLALRKRPAAGAALLCAGLFLVPSTSVVSLKEHMAEHRAYQTGFWLFLGLALLPRRVEPGKVLPGVAVLVGMLGTATGLRNQVWRSELALWQEAAVRNPESREAWYGVGDAARFARDCSTAIPAYEKVVELAPDYLDAWNNLGICRAQLGDAEGAKEAWLGALQQRPSYCRAHTNLGSLAYRQRKWEEARVELRSALAYCPENTVAHWLLGNIFYGPLRDPDKAVVHYEALVAIDPRFEHAQLAKERILELTW